MPKITVEIEYNYPADDPYWLNPHSVHHCLQKECKNTHFNVGWAPNGDPWFEPKEQDFYYHVQMVEDVL